MSPSKKLLFVAGVVIGMAIIGTAIVLTLNSPASGGTDNSRTPFGGLFERANRVSRLKKRRS